MQSGLSLPKITRQFMTPLSMGWTEAANRAGYNLNLIDMYGKNNEEMRESVQFLKQTGMVDGLIINAVGEIVSEAVGDFPAVYIDSKGLLPSVTFTEKKSIYDLTTLFLRQGLRRIAYIGGEETRTAYVLREQGYRDAMRDCGLEVDERYIHNVRMHLLGGRDAYDWVCSLPELPEAIVCMTDTVTYGLMFNLMKNHYRIPEDIAVASGEDLDMSSFFLPGITCSHISIEKMGSEAARLLTGILQGEEPDEREIEIETFLVERDSSKKYAE